MSSKRRVKKTYKRKHLIVFIFIVSLILLGVLGYFKCLKNQLNLKGYDSEITINYKGKYSGDNFTACYGNIFDCKKAKIKRIGEIDSSKLGKQKVTYEITYSNGKKKKLVQEVEIVDKEAPVITVESATVCPNGKVNNVVFTAVDNYDGDITDKAKVEYKDKKVIITVSDSSKNEAVKEIKDPSIEDKDGPVITINGNNVVSLRVNDSYEDEGASAVDKCDGEVKVTKEGSFNTGVAGSYTITYRAKDSSNNETEAERVINVYDVKNGDRVIYLTFDDGPSEHTSRLLDVLKKYNVKATFFVTNNGPDEMIKREYDEGHTVALHTATHQYSYLYSSVDNFFEDLNAVSYRVERITGHKPTMIRFPGGSSNLISADYDGGIHIMSILTDEVERRGYQYYDWNVSSGDAGGTDTSDGVYNNVISTLKEGSSIVLQHDIKGFSVDAVESIIQYGQANGYTFEKLTPASPKAHHGVNN